MSLFRKFDPYAKNQSDTDTPAKAANPAKAGQDEINEINELSPVCLFCRQPVERGQPDTGALAGEALHMDCYRKRYPQGHPLKK